MKKIGGIFLDDLRRATSNVMASVILFGLVVIPLLFTWFNVLASWDPFSNTGQLKVAVASEDTGYKSDIFPVPVNVGEKVLSELRANDKLDWVITDAEDAIDGTKSGEYYASIVLPEHFSSDMMTFYAEGSKPTEISLYTNEKKNALAPKITNKGAEGVSSQIAESFTHTLGDVSLGLISSLDEYLNESDAKATLKRIEARADGIETQLHTGARTARSMGSLVDSSVPLVESAQRIANAPRPSLSGPTGDLNLSTESLDAALSQTADSYDVVRQRIDELYDSADTSRASMQATLNTLAGQVQGQIDAYKGLRDRVNSDVKPVLPAEAAQLTSNLDEAIAAQEAVHSRLVAAANAPGAQKPDFSSIDRAQQAIESSRDSQLRTSVGKLQDSLQRIGSDIDSQGSGISLDTESLTGARDALSTLAQELDSDADRFGELKDELDRARDTGDLSRLAKVVGNNPDALASFIASPVSVDRQPVYPVASFGAGMAPLYTTLALWVGCLLTAVTLRTDVSNRDSYTVVQRFFGRFGIFALIGFFQSTLLSLGLIFFVQLEPAHPVLLWLAAWVSSTVFMMIIYTLVVSFANAGKALGVLLLVIQVSSAGGAYPLQLLPEWFQNISPWLPATYTIRAFRAAIGGVYHADYWLSLLVLLVFLLPMFFLGIVLHKPLHAYTSKLDAALAETKLM
ncbi:YhgE/Pip domain-containing protein [Corynebacterium sp. HMSC076D02]|uniref:YhgE/Pip domain-containing protein n=1 Tax=Corynebacterium sp. HMSC076D02 TaxID=1739439 RepID=UPI0008A3205B|nr:YhgE/Pip domain-containing protein [Corynebacterium sp. HMSC076D02]OFQ47489.1 phage infection protein [Corynebacterium sp. HMSC076D02]